jgi:hypothetical protein
MLSKTDEPAESTKETQSTSKAPAHSREKKQVNVKKTVHPQISDNAETQRVRKPQKKQQSRDPSF